MALRHAAALAAAFILCASEPALAQNAPITSVPNVVIPGALPDLVPVNATFTLTCAPDKKSLIANYVVTVVNKGPNANADLSKVPFNTVVKADFWSTIGNGNLEKPAQPPLMPSLGGPAIMKPGDTFKANMTIKNIPHHKKPTRPDASYALSVYVDPLQAINESNEKNNGAAQFLKDPCP